MKVLYFDCFSGISGDMTLGALIDLGIDKELVKSELDKLNLAGYDIVIDKKIVNGITGTDVHVILHQDLDQLKSEQHRHEHEDHDDHHHHHGHHHHEHPDHEHQNHRHHHQHDHHARNLMDIEALIDASDLKQSVKNFSKQVFREIAKAEAKVHHKAIHEVHFHEVGAVDSIVDIVGTAICLEILGVEKVYSSPLHDGKGFIKCQHGIIPVPVPAVMEMLSDSKIPLITEEVNTELVTPTGMGIIKCLASEFGNMPAVTIDKVGYGMGKRNTGRFNALRVVMGSLMEDNDALEEITVLETNIDDMSPEILGFTMENLFEAGALDVFYTPIYMKKNRPAVMMTVLAKKTEEEKLIDIILRQTTSLGIRRSTKKRYCMNREIVKVKTEYGEVSIKIASRDGFKKFSPEYEDCREIAKKTGVELDKVYKAAYESAKGLY
ncbi:MAG: nickel pincer cofactor biosynthesis protein LarC [Clostridia bacterium]|nr:nickel pincer cofactor biosynthesis protein LarC [Clostridia bacterium]